MNSFTFYENFGKLSLINITARNPFRANATRWSNTFK